MKHRHAISPVLATVVLIAITLIAAIAIAGFVFGLFGTFANQPLLSVKQTTCDQNGCSILVYNQGGIAGSIVGASNQFQLLSGQSSGAIEIQPNHSALVNVTATLNTGDSITGYLIQGNGPYLQFSATVG